MIWLTLTLFVVSFFASALLAPKPDVENARAGKLSDIRFPIASEGTPVPMIFGKVRMRSPNCLWYGQFRTRAIKKNIKTGIFSSETAVTGYRYYIGLHLGLCLGPGVVLRKIWTEKKILWQTGIGLGPAPAEFQIDEPSIYGGSKRGGGFTGTCTFYGGEFTQARNSYLEEHLGSDVPGYVGMSHIVFHKPYIGTSPQLRALSFELERYPDNLGLDPGDLIIGYDLNPMEVLYSAITEEWGGVGVDPSNIDTTSWIAAGETLSTEGNGMSLIVSSSNDAKSIAQEVLRQVDGILYQDPETGSIVAKLIRNDYVIGSLPVFNESNVKQVKDFGRSSWAETYNQVRGSFTYRNKKYESGTAAAQDMANINMQGRIRSTTVSFPGVTEGSTAVDLTTRELSQLSIPLYKANLETTREGTQLRPGDPFLFSWADYGLSDVVLRVQRYNLGDLDNGAVTMDVLQDRFAVANTLFTAPEGTLWGEVDRTAVPIVDFQAMETPYWFLQKIARFDVEPDSSYFWGLAKDPGLMQTFDFITSADNFVLDTTVDLNQIDFTPAASLQGALYLNMGLTTGVVDQIIVNDIGPDPDDSFGFWDEQQILDDASSSEIRSYGKNLIVINGEILAYEAYTKISQGVYRLETVHRALLDTQFEDHADGDAVYFLNDIGWLSQNIRTDTGILFYKFLSYSDQDAQDITDVSSSSVTADQRYDRPLPPDDFDVEGSRRPTQIIGQTTVDITGFRERNRVTPESVVLYTDSADTPESSTTYNARFYLDDILLDTITGFAYGSLPVSFTGLSGAGTGRIELESVRNALTSWTPDLIEFYFAYYQNLTADLVTDGDMESLAGWSEPQGDWNDESTVYPLDALKPGSKHAESLDAGTNELRQDITVSSYQGDAAVFRVYKGGLTEGITSQVTLEQRDGGGLLDSISTPLVVATDLGLWDMIEIPVPIRSDAVTLRIKLLAEDGGASFDECSFQANTVSTTSATSYDLISGLTVAGAWGLRLMVSTYVGALVKIRDTYDDTETDLFSDIDGNLEWYQTRGEARVVRLYDQSGNAAHLEAESAVEQPRLRHMLSETGRPSIDFEGSEEALLDTVAGTTRPYMLARPNCCFAIGPKETTGNDYILTIPHTDAGHSSPYARWGMVTDSTGWIINVNGSIGTDPGNGPSNSGKNVWFLDYQQGEAYHNEDTTSVKSWAAADITYPNSTRLRFAETPTGSLEWDGDFHELCMFTGTISAANRKTIMESVALYWFALAV